MAKKPIPNPIEALRAEVDRASHPAARHFSMLAGKEWDAFLADIRENGQLKPIIVDPDGEVLDGRNRLLACKVLRTDPVTETRNLVGSAAVAFVISMNIARRHDDAGVRAMQTAKLMELAATERSENFPVLTQAAAAEAAGVSDHTLRDAQRLLKQAPDIAAEVEKNSISLHGARHLAKLPESAERQETLNKVRQSASKTTAKTILKSIKKRSPPAGGKIEIPGMYGEWNKLLHVIEAVPRLAGELRNLGTLMDERRLPPSHARKVKGALKALNKVDFPDLIAAIRVAIPVLDAVIKDDAEQTEPDPENAPMESA